MFLPERGSNLNIFLLASILFSSHRQAKPQLRLISVYNIYSMTITYQLWLKN
jgi:hypothetical protein